jgi:ribosomal protein S18 acetylase RimI-like enzyme
MEFFKRQSTEKDKEFVYTLARTVYKDLVIKQFGKWDEKWQRDYFEEKWKHSDYQIVEKNGRKIGAIWITQHSNHIVLNEIQLLPEFQSQGIGTELIMEQLKTTREKNIPIRLRVLKLNRARSWYEKHGFIVCGETDAHYLMECIV